MPKITKETATQVALKFVKAKKGLEKIDVALVEGNGSGWIVRGTYPLDVAGHPWPEKFAVTIDAKGKIVSSDFALL